MSSKIKYLVMDVGGTLTDGKIYMGANGKVMKSFDIKDGCGIHDLLPQCITPVIITGWISKIVENSCAELGIKDLFHGVHDKTGCFKAFFDEKGGDISEVAYIGDDLNDLPCMQQIKDAGGLVLCTNNAVQGVLDLSNYVSCGKSGDRAVIDSIEELQRRKKGSNLCPQNH